MTYLEFATLNNYRRLELYDEWLGQGGWIQVYLASSDDMSESEKRILIDDEFNLWCLTER